jgi:hypothetical protein
VVGSWGPTVEVGGPVVVVGEPPEDDAGGGRVAAVVGVGPVMVGRGGERSAVDMEVAGARIGGVPGEMARPVDVGVGVAVLVVVGMVMERVGVVVSTGGRPTASRTWGGRWGRPSQAPRPAAIRLPAIHHRTRGRRRSGVIEVRH